MDAMERACLEGVIYRNLYGYDLAPAYSLDPWVRNFDRVRYANDLAYRVLKQTEYMEKAPCCQKIH